MRRDRNGFPAAPQHVHMRIAQKAERAVGHRLEVAIVPRHIVVAQPDEGEIAGDQPLQELDRFGDFLHHDRRRVGFELRDDARHPLQHRAPVLHADAHLREHLLQRLHDLHAPRRVADVFHMDMNEALAQHA